jgi:drug/metabolite transporter (DMT)-like permease
VIEGIALAVAAAFVYGFLGISFEIAGKQRYKIWDVILVKQFTGFVIGIACTALLHLSLWNPKLIGLGFIGAVSYVITLSAYLVASREKDIATNWTIVNLSVVVPILISIFWFGDSFTILKGAGVLLTLASIVLIGRGIHAPVASGASSSRWLTYITIAFLLNGVLVILFRFVPEGDGALFTAYFYGISFLLVLPYKLVRDRTIDVSKGLIGVSVMGAATHWSGIMLTILALAQVNKASAQTGVVVYPITNGLVIPVGVILGAIILRQHITRRTGYGVALGVCALLCLFSPA